MNSLIEINCKKCGGIAQQVLNLQERCRVGWYCINPNCNHFEKAILRERAVTDEHLIKGKA